MRVARLLLCYVLLEDYSTNLGGAAITSDAGRQDAFATYPTPPDFPRFTAPIGNVSAAIGKEAILPCTIRKLGNYKVAWLRMEDRTILSIDQRTVTHSSRFVVTVENTKVKNQSQSKKKEEEEATLRLHIRQLREADRGCYMCQVNTEPMSSQLGCVDVLVPPDIVSPGTSEGEVTVREGHNATLSCNASGRPPPRVSWKREKSDFILMRSPNDSLTQVDSRSGEKLELTRVDRKQMGAYLCIARNEVPPTVSKRVNLRVNFPPIVRAIDEAIGSPLDMDVSLTCVIEAYPKTINVWRKQPQEAVIMSNDKYELNERGDKNEEWKTTFELKIRRLNTNDLGGYTCSASSALGTANATVRVHEIDRPTQPTQATSVNWKRLSKERSKLAHVTTINHIFHQMSTPAMQKSTARIVYNKYATTSTTADPRAPFVKDSTVYKSREIANVRNCVDANVMNVTGVRIYALCFLFFLGLR